MKVELKLKQEIQVYDLVTTFAVSAPAPGLQRLCTFAQDRGGRIQSSDLEEEFGLKPGAARNLYQNGIMTEVWNAEGELTENGRHTIQTGEVMVKEVGAIRAWVFEHQATGPVLLHADRIDRLPKGDAEPQAKHWPGIIDHLSGHAPTKSLLTASADSKRWAMHSKDSTNRNAWASVEKYRTTAELSWVWTFDGASWAAQDALALTCVLRGTNKNPGSDGKRVEGSFRASGKMNPEACVQKWLSTGDFADGRWNADLNALGRRLADLTTEEQLSYTLNVTLDEGTEGWDGDVVFSDIPLTARNIEDGANWIQNLTLHHTPGYTTAEEIKRLPTDLMQEPPFSHLDADQVQKRLDKHAEDGRLKPRLAWLFTAGDDLGSMAFEPMTSTGGAKQSDKVEHDGSNDFAETVTAITSGIKGDVGRVVIVDRYLQNSATQRKVEAFRDALKSCAPDAQLHVLTAHTHFTKNKEGAEAAEMQQKLRSKLEQVSSTVQFMEERDAKPPHDRYIIIESSKESHVWHVPNTLFQGTEKKAMYKTNQINESSVFEHLDIRGFAPEVSA